MRPTRSFELQDRESCRLKTLTNISYIQPELCKNIFRIQLMTKMFALIVTIIRYVKDVS